MQCLKILYHFCTFPIKYSKAFVDYWYKNCLTSEQRLFRWMRVKYTLCVNE